MFNSHRTALHWAAKRNQLEIAQYLVDNGADISTQSFSKEVPADLTTNPALTNLLGSPKMKSDLPVNKIENGNDQVPYVPLYLLNESLTHKVRIDDSPSKALPLNCGSIPKQEMILKVRLAHSMDEDFIEVEVQKSELTYAKLMEVCCSELSLNPKYVERLRKLPNTRLRNDRDVQRIGQLQEIEVVLVGSRPRLPQGVAQDTSSTTNIVGPPIKNQTILY